MLGHFAALLIQTTIPAACSLSQDERAANRGLSFAEFDQGQSALAHTAWNLSMAGCHAQSAAADADYLLHGPKLDDRQRVVLGWHMALSLARSGHEDAAAPLVAASIQDLPEQPDAFDWNTYVRGVYGFLTKDRGLLERSLQNLQAAPGQRNALNAKALARLARCFDKSYAAAVAEGACTVD
jgi:hypothetical protein